MVGGQYKPGELGKSEWDTIRDAPPWAVDAWGLGCLMQEAFSRQYMTSVEQLRWVEVNRGSNSGGNLEECMLMYSSTPDDTGSTIAGYRSTERADTACYKDASGKLLHLRAGAQTAYLRHCCQTTRSC
jgi:hypothetical protein